MLGPTGRNFGAGMSGGVAYVYDPDGRSATASTPRWSTLEPLDDDDRHWLVSMVRRHAELTDSAVARRLLAEWERSVEEFVKVMPRDYRRVLEATRRAIDEGRSVDEAVMASAHG